MDGREAMAYYMQRGMAGSGSGTQPGALHGSAAMRPFSGPGQPLQPLAGGSSVGAVYSVEESMSGHGANLSSSSAMPPGQPVKRKRGRPRKYGPDGSVALALSPISSSSPQAAAGGSAPPMQKRGRGRPPGSGKKQQLASLGM